MSNISDIFIAAFLREEVFYSEYGSVVDVGMFDDSASKICIGVYIDYVNKYNKLPEDQDMYTALDFYCKKYGIDSNVKQLAIEKLQHCYEMSYTLEYARDNFIKFATLNKLTSAVLEAAKDIKTKGDNLSEKDYEKIHNRIEDAISIKARDTLGVLLSDVGDNPKDFIESQNRFDKNTVVPTGFPTFDTAHIAGGPLPGELYVISAPPGRGKSTVLVNIGAYASLQGKDVIHIFVGDNTEADGVLRYCARMTGVTMSQIMLNSQQYLSSWSYLKENFNLGNVLIGAYPIGSPSISDIRSFITKNMVRHSIKPAVVIIDYVDNCRKNPNMNPYEAIGELYESLKNMAEELKLVVWTASQPKIEYWDEENPGLSSLAESSKKQHILDGMLTMNKSGDSSYKITVPKLRRGRSDFDFDVSVNYDKMQVKESFSSRINSEISNKPSPATDVTTMNLPESPFKV